jgi:hypothetical protein
MPLSAAGGGQHGAVSRKSNPVAGVRDTDRAARQKLKQSKGLKRL